MDKVGAGAGIVAAKLLDVVLPFKWTAQGKAFKAQKEWQGELENTRMNFQLQLEAKRQQLQENIEKRREELQKYLGEQNIDNSRKIALFQARAMRQTQMLVSQQNARNALRTTFMQDALRTFPLNVSPLVLLSNQSHSMGYLLNFSEQESEVQVSIPQVYEEVEEARKHPDALNIFIAPIHVDSKIKNRKVLSEQIWDTVYMRMESFFTEHYNRSADHPVIFYPTAWNDKYNPGMHASETLHFFLKDLPCIVIEPRFDGTKFRLMFSAWGLGYNSSTHHRTELSFDINIDAVLAKSVYERSKKALTLIDTIKDTKILNKDKQLFYDMGYNYMKNVRLFESLDLEQRMADGRMDEVDALGIYNIFKIEPSQDLAPLASHLSEYIALNLALLTDIHHLRSSDVIPKLPSLLKEYFPQIYADRDMRACLYKEYENSYEWLCEEERHLNIHDTEGIRKMQMLDVKKWLNMVDKQGIEDEVYRNIREYVEKRSGFTHLDFDEVWNRALDDMTSYDLDFFEKVKPNLDETKKRDLKRKIEKMKK